MRGPVVRAPHEMRDIPHRPGPDGTVIWTLRAREDPVVWWETEFGDGAVIGLPEEDLAW